MRHRSRARQLRLLASGLTALDPAFVDQFLCPVCSKVFPLFAKEEITEAHIVPRAAGATLKTFLCRRCNSTFGANQDKWFGERVRLANMPSPDIFATRIQPSHFTIDGMRAHGSVRSTPAGGIDLMIHDNRNSPQVRDALDHKFAHNPTTLSVDVPFPLLRQNSLVRAGYMTAGYLLWFRAFGYSWALQKHLDPIRQQILNPNEEIVQAAWGTSRGARWTPWIGVVTIDEHAVLAFGLNDQIVLFPAADRPHIDLRAYLARSIDVVFRSLALPRRPLYEVPLAFMADDRMLIAPDALLHRGVPCAVVRLDTSTNRVQQLYPISKEEFTRQARTPAAAITRLDLRHLSEPLPDA